MNNRTQQRFDRSIREALEATAEADARKPRRDVRPSPSPRMSAPPRKCRRMVLLMDPETGGTVLVPWNHPLAVAKRAKEVTS